MVGVSNQRQVKIFVFSKKFQTGSGASPSFYSMGTGGPFGGVKLLR
jgi:hypothetical protein